METIGFGTGALAANAIEVGTDIVVDMGKVDELVDRLELEPALVDGVVVSVEVPVSMPVEVLTFSYLTSSQISGHE
jgi:hypothetical protein